MRVHIMTASGLDPSRDALVEEWVAEHGDVCVHDDVDRRGVLWNHRRIVGCLLREARAGGTLGARGTVLGRRGWSLVVQDDAVGLPGWENHLDEVKWNAPKDTPFISLSHFSTFGQKLVDRGIPFGRGVNCIWGQAVLYRHDVLEEYLRLVDDIYKMDAEGYRKWDDGIMAVFNLLYGTKSAMTSRALFEHQDWDSTMGHVPGQWRHAAATIRDYPYSPKWSARPNSGGGMPSPERIQKELAEKVEMWRLGR